MTYKSYWSLTSCFECFRRNGEVSPLTSSIVHVTLWLLGFLGNHPNWNACQKSEEWYIREVGKSNDRDESNDWNLKLGTGNSVYVISRGWRNLICIVHLFYLLTKVKKNLYLYSFFISTIVGSSFSIRLLIIHVKKYLIKSIKYW